MPYNNGENVLAEKCYRIVAVKGGTGQDWAAYQGPPEWSTEQGCRDGDKLLEGVATALFPAVAHQYRWRD